MYVLTVAVDACFRLKRRAVSNETKDPILGSGWGYFVEDTGYRDLLAAYSDQEEVRCLFNAAYACSLTIRGYVADINVHGPVGVRSCEHEVLEGLRSDGRGRCYLRAP